MKRDREVAEVRRVVREGLTQETCREGGAQGCRGPTTPEYDFQAFSRLFPYPFQLSW